MSCGCAKTSQINLGNMSVAKLSQLSETLDAILAAVDGGATLDVTSRVETTGDGEVSGENLRSVRFESTGGSAVINGVSLPSGSVIEFTKSFPGDRLPGFEWEIGTATSLRIDTVTEEE